MDNVGIVVEDLKAAIAFFVELGVEIEGQATVEGQRQSAPNEIPVNTLGIRRIMFTVTGIDDVVTRLKKLGAKLVGDIAQYEDTYRLCYLRGPEGIMVALAEELG
jgi:predicted enzyme related to lactoylglutathione lyase